MIEPLSFKKRLAYLVVFVVLFIVLVPIVVLYSSGYRLGDNYTLVKTGGIYIYPGESGTSIYVDRTLERVTNPFQKGVFVSELKPGRYFIKVFKEGKYPWVKSVTVLPQKVVESYPFLPPVNPVVASTTSTSTAQFQTLTTLFRQKPLSAIRPNATSTVATTTAYGLVNRDIVVWKDGDVIKARWVGQASEIPFYFCAEDLVISSCHKDMTVYTTTKLGTIEFYPGRNDVLMFVNAEGLFAVELDKREPQNVIPLVKQKDLDLRVLGEQVFVKKGNTIYKVSL